MDALKRCLPALVRLVHHSDREIIADACWALSYITDGTNDKIQEVIDSGELSEQAVLIIVGHLVLACTSSKICVI